jgi:hypothetical protein
MPRSESLVMAISSWSYRRRLRARSGKEGAVVPPRQTGKRLSRYLLKPTPKTLTCPSPFRIIVTTPNLRSLALPATNGDEPADAMNLASPQSGPTKETFIEA